MTIQTRQLSSKYNGRKGGRPKSNSVERIELPDINLVILTPNQYGSLVEKYGYEFIKKALSILESWLAHGGKSSVKYIGKNHYAHFRSDGWVVNTTKREENFSAGE